MILLAASLQKADVNGKKVYRWPLLFQSIEKLGKWIHNPITFEWFRKGIPNILENVGQINIMTKLGHVWAVITNLLTTGVILAMFSRVSGSFETMVLGGLAILYVTIIGSFSLMAKAKLDLEVANAGRFARLGDLLNDPHKETYDAVVEEILDMKKKTTVRFYINGGFNLLNSLIAIIYILGAL